MNMCENDTLIVDCARASARAIDNASQVRLGSPWSHRSANHGRLLAVALALGLLANATNSPAATLIWTNTNASATWQTISSWNASAFPGAGDWAEFTNGGTYYVTLNADVLNLGSITFNSTKFVTPIVTLDLGGNSLSVINSAGTTPPAFEVADVTSSTVTVYIASSTAVGKGLFVTNVSGTASKLLIGRNGTGILIITNGFVAANATALGNGGSSKGSSRWTRPWRMARPQTGSIFFQPAV